MTDIAQCAAYLRHFNQWRRGDESLNMPEPKEIGRQIDFACEVLEAMAAHDHLMVIAATRYCMGRMTYIVGNCVDWLIQIWPLLSVQTRNIIRRDIEEAFDRDDRDREFNHSINYLGHDCDRKEWERVRRLWAESGGHE